MGQHSEPVKAPAEQVIKEIRRATRRQFSAEEKIRIVLSGLRGEDSIAELCRREGIVQNLYYRWSKEFLEAGKKRLAGDTARSATPQEVKDLRREAGALKEVVAELVLENRLLKKTRLAKLTGIVAVRGWPGRHPGRDGTGCAGFARAVAAQDGGADPSTPRGWPTPARACRSGAAASR